MFDHNWASRSHADIHRAIQAGGTDGFADGGSGWKRLSDRMEAVTASVARAGATIQSTWQGDASRAAQGAVQPLDPWVQASRHLSQGVADASQKQADRLVATRGAIPPPDDRSFLEVGWDNLTGTGLAAPITPIVAGGAGPVAGVGAGVGGWAVDYFTQDARRAEAEEAARQTMNQYQADSGAG